MKGISLQDQLLKSGLISKGKAKTVKTNQRKQAKQARKQKNVAVVDEAKLLAQQVKLEQLKKDQVLNQHKQKLAAEKAVLAQIKQLVQKNKLAQNLEGCEAYNFTDANKVKKIYVSEKMRQDISKGVVAIVKVEASYELVPAVIAHKIAERNADYVLVLNEAIENTSIDDDPYADYQIPDDLMW